MKDLLRIKRGKRWWTALRGSPCMYTVCGKEAEVLVLLVGGPGVLVDESVTTVLVLMLIIPSSVIKITKVRVKIFTNINIFFNIRYYFW